jgi:P4 family phage/plasmid primase-like protien
MISPQTVQLYLASNKEIIPLNNDPSDKYRGKRPLHNDWLKREYAKDEITYYLSKGHNLGWRLGKNDLVIDVDKKDNGLESLEKFLSQFNLTVDDITSKFPTVQTGGGGLHIYTRIPYQFKSPETFKDTFPGIEFKRHGRQVVIPGSFHYGANRPYKWDQFSPYDEPTKTTPTSIINWLKAQYIYHFNGSKPPKLSTDQLAKLLDAIPVEDFDNNDSWFQLLSASHHATHGKGIAEFLAWSLSDPRYASHERLIRVRWNSLDIDKQGGITAATLIQIAGKYDNTLVHELNSTDAKNDFEKVILKPDKPKLLNQIQTWTPETNSTEIESVLKQIGTLSPLDTAGILQLIKAQTNYPLSTLKESVKQIEKRKKHFRSEQAELDDLAQKISTLVLCENFEDGRHLIHAPDQRFWEYCTTHWECMSRNILLRHIHDACDTYKSANPAIEFSVSALIHQVEFILMAKTATKVDLHRVKEGLPSVINTKTCELWIDAATGEVTPKDHSPESYLTSCLDIEYDPNAECPKYLSALKEIFRPEGNNTGRMIDHIFELHGYIIQPHKNIPVWIQFHGLGANGKSMVLDVWSATCCDAMIEKSIKELDPSTYSHAFADLPGKLMIRNDDVKARTLLPDDTLKKISENKVLTANPKNHPTFRFRSTATIVLASNSFPQTSDLSDGIRRRAVVVPFKRKFSEAEQDLDIGKDIIASELSGVLNYALKGLQRLRKRGRFAVPKSCEVAAKTWVLEANPFHVFVDDCYTHDINGRLEFVAVWSRYRMWVVENELPRPLSKVALSRALAQIGLEVRRSTGGSVYVYGIDDKEEEEW